jgi:alkanesulfonate monooxygenase SsuD/methylene tetrahydromethanopterin reductase-like flavin-dependent oxidoreductase (luciferase family)
MNVASVALRNPLVLAKQCATIDVLSNGRILPAFGIGSTFSADWRTTGTPTKRRGKRTDEGLEIIGRLWRGETVTLDGEFFQYDGVRISPLPVQKELPLWIGGSSQAAIRRTVKYGTGWQASFESPEQAGVTVDAIKQGMKDAGREFEDDHFGTGINFRFGKWDDDVVVRAAERFERVGGRDSRQSFAVGGAQEILDKVRAFAAAGLPKLILRPLASDDADTMRQTQLMIEEVQPAIRVMSREMNMD